MNPWEMHTLQARVSLDLWADAIEGAANDESWAWIADDMTAHLFDEVPVAPLLAAIEGGSE